MIPLSILTKLLNFLSLYLYFKIARFSENINSILKQSTMKKVLTLTALMSLLNTFLFAQNDKWQFGISVNPNYSYRILYSENADVKATFDALESGKISGSVGGFMEKKTSTRGRVRVGVNLMNWGFVINRKFGSRSQNSNGTFDPFLFVDLGGFRITNNFVNLEVPVDYQYFINKKRTFYVNGGISPSYFLASYTTTTITSGDGSTQKSTSKNAAFDDDKKLFFGLQLGLGFEWKIQEKLTIDFQPRGQIMFNDLSNLFKKDRLLPYNVGLQMGVKF
jgi:opacity protein-like surface antigen